MNNDKMDTWVKLASATDMPDVGKNVYALIEKDDVGQGQIDETPWTCKLQWTGEVWQLVNPVSPLDAILAQNFSVVFWRYE